MEVFTQGFLHCQSETIDLLCEKPYRQESSTDKSRTIFISFLYVIHQ